ncbi:hypothetical protein HPB50_008512 [Hyalomma asiaticum]|uniref:Uncharacterized protein n=1 Tax=Hyalomma asiaticum TaxID=266040 RepID=A0ACB7T4B9_HYAAI|nr:hypothetical protein HPB50_008512 [Hyalomma asiaticum]
MRTHVAPSIALEMLPRRKTRVGSEERRDARGVLKRDLRSNVHAYRRAGGRRSARHSSGDPLQKTPSDESRPYSNAHDEEAEKE